MRNAPLKSRHAIPQRHEKTFFISEEENFLCFRSKKCVLSRSTKECNCVFEGSVFIARNWDVCFKSSSPIFDLEWDFFALRLLRALQTARDAKLRASFSCPEAQVTEGSKKKAKKVAKVLSHCRVVHSLKGSWSLLDSAISRMQPAKSR